MAELINRKLAIIFGNGRGEVGLEVGSDPGLAESEYIRIPRCMEKLWVAKIEDIAIFHLRTVKGAGKKSEAEVDVSKYLKWDEKKSLNDYANAPGWVSDRNLAIWKGSLWTSARVTGEYDDDEAGAFYWFKISEFHIEPFTYDDIRAFYSVNENSIRIGDIDASSVAWVHAVRFWSVVSGFVKGGKASESVMVDNPTTYPDDTPAIASFISDFHTNAWTACAARATSWRKSNHATGGDRVTGFPRRWLQKMGYLINQGDRARQNTHERELTTAFYLATHAAQVHPVLSLMAPTDTNNCAHVNPICGLIPEWEVKESTQIRMVPNTQVAGTAMVVDAMVTLKMMVKEGIAPLLTSHAQVDALASAYETVEAHGTAVASYSHWFLAGHINNPQPVAFSQKDAAFSELIGELAIVATKYYVGTTIADSKALDNAASQMGEDSARTLWAALGREKRTLSAEQISRVYARVKGSASSAALSNLLSTNRDECNNAVVTYNAISSQIAGRIGILTAPSIRSETVYVATSGVAIPNGPV